MCLTGEFGWEGRGRRREGWKERKERKDRRKIAFLFAVPKGESEKVRMGDGKWKMVKKTGIVVGRRRRKRKK